VRKLLVESFGIVALAAYLFVSWENVVAELALSAFFFLYLTLSFVCFSLFLVTAHYIRKAVTEGRTLSSISGFRRHDGEVDMLMFGMLFYQRLKQNKLWVLYFTSFVIIAMGLVSSTSVGGVLAISESFVLLSITTLWERGEQADYLIFNNKSDYYVEYAKNMAGM